VSNPPEKYDPHSRFDMEFYEAGERIWLFPYLKEPKIIGVPTSPGNCIVYGAGFAEEFLQIKPLELNSVYGVVMDLSYGGYEIIYEAEFCIIKTAAGKKYLAQNSRKGSDTCTTEPLDKLDKTFKRKLF